MNNFKRRAAAQLQLRDSQHQRPSWFWNQSVRLWWFLAAMIMRNWSSSSSARIPITSTIPSKSRSYSTNSSYSHPDRTSLTKLSPTSANLAWIESSSCSAEWTVLSVHLVACWIAERAHLADLNRTSAPFYSNANTHATFSRHPRTMSNLPPSLSIAVLFLWLLVPFRRCRSNARRQSPALKSPTTRYQYPAPHTPLEKCMLPDP